MNVFRKVLIILFIALCLSCENKVTELTWENNFPLIGSQSSPRATDLNGDDVLDIVIGAGRAELDSTPMGVLALDGRTGEILWQEKTQAQIIGSAIFTDVTDDGINDVFIGGRNHVFKAINGSTGKIIWQYKYDQPDDPILQFARFNFYNSSLVEDVNSNGYPELLVVNGGNWDAQPNETSDRYPGVLMLMDTKDGNVIAADTMPDGMESYMSPLIYKDKVSGKQNILFGTGGETIEGSIYMTTLENFKENNLQKATKVITEEGHGYIAPPVLLHLNDDEVIDFVVASHTSRLSAIDGKTNQLLWEQSFEGYECSSSFAVGNFTDDEVPDVFTVLSKGVWPDYNHGLHIMINGATGAIEYKESLGCYSLSTPVAYDLTKDGIDEIIISINKYNCDIEVFEGAKATDDMINVLTAINFETGAIQEIDRSAKFRNVYGSPWIGDIDDDKYLDIVYVQNFDPGDLFKVRGMRMKRISTSIKMKDSYVAWGEYMGQDGKGIYIK